MKYDDMVIKNSRAIGSTEAQLGGVETFAKELYYAMAMADVTQKKFQPIFQKDYEQRRNFLRTFVLNSEIDWMITTITDEAISLDETNYFCYPSTAQLEISEEITESLSNEFKKIYNKYNFCSDITSWQTFRQFLIDGVMAFEIVYDQKGQNIIGFKSLDVISLKSDVKMENGILKKIWYQYPDKPGMTRMLYDTQVVYIALAQGALPQRVSYAENLVRSFNLLRMVENAQAMWMLMNSTWRLKMIVPVGARSPQKIRESLGEMMSIYKEDIRLDPSSGEVTINGSPTMQYYKNYLFPQKNGESVDIQTVAGEGPDMNESPLLNYFTNKLKEDSKIPWLRFDKTANGGQLTSQAAGGVDREEIRFGKYINRLRSSFQELLIKPLWIQMCLKYPALEEDEIFKSSLGLRFVKDNLFEEIRNNEIMTKRAEFIQTMLQIPFVDEKPFFSVRWLVQTYMKLDKDALDANASIRKADLDALAGASGGDGGGGGAGPEGGGGGAGPEGGGGGKDDAGGGLGF